MLPRNTADLSSFVVKKRRRTRSAAHDRTEHVRNAYQGQRNRSTRGTTRLERNIPIAVITASLPPASVMARIANRTGLVARMERSEMRELPLWRVTPDFATHHPGYGLLRSPSTLCGVYCWGEKIRRQTRPPKAPPAATPHQRPHRLRPQAAHLRQHRRPARHPVDRKISPRVMVATRAGSQVTPGHLAIARSTADLLLPTISLWHNPNTKQFCMSTPPLSNLIQ